MKTWTHWYERDDSTGIAIEKQLLTLKDLKARVAGWYGALSATDAQTVVLYEKNTFEFLACFLAILHLRKIPCLVQTAHKNQDSFPRTQKRVFAVDFTPPLHQTCDLSPLFPEQYCLFFTSGSTGAPKAIAKTLAQLQTEAALIHRTWPLDPLTIISTVSHQHLYGFTFKLLWPFLYNHHFFATDCQYTEDIAAQASTTTSFALISSPSHLKRLSKAILWSQFAPQCQKIISAAAPLPLEVSQSVAQDFQQPVEEIYGSTETGIIAWRNAQNKHYPLWTPFLGIAITTEPAPVIHTPLLPMPIASSDTLVLKGRRFELLGRQDRIVKIEGKRVSLQALENTIECHPAVEKANVLVLDLKNRQETAAVCQLHPDSFSHTLDLHSLKKSLRQQLLLENPALVCPRRWRFVRFIPENAQGKPNTAQMQRWFLQRTSPMLERLTQCENETLEFELKVAKDLIFFQGHFPNTPILPGIVQTQWAHELGALFLETQGAFLGIEALKFKRIIAPDTSIKLTLQLQSNKKILFEYISDKQSHSSGRLCYG